MENVLVHVSSYMLHHFADLLKMRIDCTEHFEGTMNKSKGTSTLFRAIAENHHYCTVHLE